MIYRVLAILSLLSAFFIAGFAAGEIRAGQKHIDFVGAQAAASVRVIRAQEKVVTQIQVKYVDRIKTIYRKGEEIEKQVPVYVTAADNDRCSVNAGFVRVYDAAWVGEPAGAGADSDRASSGVSLAEVAEVSAANATACRAWREQALGWQEFYRGLQKATAKNE